MRRKAESGEGVGPADVMACGSRLSVSPCNLCPRECGVDRAAGQVGYCLTDHRVFVARAALHMWEEPCISGEKGSGTVFFSGCNLRCVYCQNYEIADGKTGERVSVERLAEIFLELQEQGANNINLVTAGHFLPAVVRALLLAKDQGLKIPVVYNTGGYEKADTLRMLDGLVDIWLPDYKYQSADLACRYSHAADYPVQVKEALTEMVRQTGSPVFDNRGMMERGVIVRHLVLPGCVYDSKDVLEYLHDTWGTQIWVSIMSQYTPLPHVMRFPELDRNVTEEEYKEVVEYALFLGMKQVYIQTGGCVGESFIPAFDCSGIRKTDLP